jgi:hypothetical protein
MRQHDECLARAQVAALHLQSWLRSVVEAEGGDPFAALNRDACHSLIPDP